MFAFNVAAALSEPGEYVLSPESDRAFVLPARPEQPVEMAMLDSLLHIEAAHDVVVERVALEKTLSNTVAIDDSSRIIIRDCFAGHSGREAIDISGGDNVVIRSCILTDTSETAAILTGGDRQTLQPSGHTIENSVLTGFGIDAWTYRPAVRMNGVGQRVTGSYIAGGAHAGITLSGNDHRIIGNELTGLVTKTDDAGAIYMSRDWTGRGQLIEGNYIHGLGGPHVADKRYVVGVYLDDQFSGVTVQGNVFADVSTPILIGGGRDNQIVDNLFLRPGRASVHLDNRGQTWQREMVKSGILRRRLARVPYRSPIYKARYPQLAAMPDEDLGAPLGNRLIGNVTVAGEPLVLRGATAAALAVDKAGPVLTKDVEASLANAQTARQIQAALRMVPDEALHAMAVADQSGLRDRLFFHDKIAQR